MEIKTWILRVSLWVFCFSGVFGAGSWMLTLAQEDVAERQIEAAKFVKRIQGEIDESKKELDELNLKIEDMNLKIVKTRLQTHTLNKQLLNLDEQIKDTIEIVENVKDQIYRRTIEIKDLELESEFIQGQVNQQKLMLEGYLEMLYRDQNSLRTLDNKLNEVNLWKILIQADKSTEILQATAYAEALEKKGREMFLGLANLIDKLQEKQRAAKNKKANLEILQAMLITQEDQLRVQREAKKNLLEMTKGQEVIYQSLLEESRKQQEELEIDLMNLSNNLEFVRKKIAQDNAEFNPDDYSNLFSGIDKESLMNFLSSLPGENSEFSPRWPVSPSRGVSAFFREKSYYDFFKMQHNAIDIRAYQSTPIKAPADGFVYKAKDNGYGYSYLILTHANGFMTVYGHVSSFKVKEGQKVKTGDIIALSGATPGTRGAGLYTTGPHLHFEILKDGKYVDPLLYLNLGYLNIESLPPKYQAKALGEKQKVRRMHDDSLVVKEVGMEN